ncbi:MAG: protein-L-isoaspartate(D-aspartate) O-methyltransferase [Ginsengibacter sp.]|jgi:protein-L-isoaspartate(D-aspartate) O-methyltransferase
MGKMEDSYRHKGLRKILIETLREKGIKDEVVLNAMMNIPRHFFLDGALEKIAYEDRAFPIASGQTISQPYTVAFQTQLLDIKRFDKVLEIGTGSVYQASVLAELGAMVYTIERQRELFELNKTFCLKSKYPNIHFFYGDGFEGLPTYAPFHKILITAAAPQIPPKLIAQLKVGGYMVLPLNDETEGHQIMMRLTKNEDGSLTEERFSNFSFVPMLKGRN